MDWLATINDGGSRLRIFIDFTRAKRKMCPAVVPFIDSWPTKNASLLEVHLGRIHVYNALPNKKDGSGYSIYIYKYQEHYICIYQARQKVDAIPAEQKT